MDNLERRIEEIERRIEEMEREIAHSKDYIRRVDKQVYLGFRASGQKSKSRKGE